MSKKNILNSIEHLSVRIMVVSWRPLILQVYLDFLLSLLLVALLLLPLYIVVLFWKCTPLVFLFCVQISCSHEDISQITLIQMVKNLPPV